MTYILRKRAISMNTISLLNSFYREDVITDLLCNLINHEKAFARWFVRNICGMNDLDGQYIAHARLGLGKGIGTPDLIIEQQQEGKTKLIIVIENKLGALEGNEQTNRYASDEGRNRLYTNLQANHNTPIHYLFLTLDPYTKAKNPQFGKIDYRGFIDMDWTPFIRDESARMLLSDYTALLKEFYEPILSVQLTDHIVHKTTGLSALQKKLIWINMFQSAQGKWLKDMMITHGEAGGFGRNAAVFLFSKKHWTQEPFDGNTLSANSINIHFELSINLLNDKGVSDFHLHYEPNPYQPKNRYASVSGYEQYVELRERRKAHFHELIRGIEQSEAFSLRNGSNSILHIKMKRHETFEEVMDELGDVMGRISLMVNEMLDIISSDHSI